MKKNYKIESSKVDRKTAEKNRRSHMKCLCFKLASIIPKPHNSHKDTLSQQDRLDHAAAYIKGLQERVEELKRKKQFRLGTNNPNKNFHAHTTNPIWGCIRLPVLELRDMESTLEVVLITSLDKNFMFYQVISILEEEGANVLNANSSTVGDKVFHTIHSQVKSCRVGVETSRLSQRLKELIGYLV
ncbi:Transcription factor bhlh [Thalictrum thalictroides]|uniref:Transcription factor bhlh n=1 Tax=Thalictrum thalictroides TaxID=46969 RepID=A0A7J6VYF1_THATH|nr:Transcription factor bhlh [Thalictrum thalictroides]